MINQYELRESTVRRSHVFQNFNPGRSFISTALVNDSVAYGDDLRKYPICYQGPVYKTYPTTKKLILGRILVSLWYFKLSKSRDFPTKSSFWGWSWRKRRGSSSMLKAMRFKFDSSPRSVSIMRVSWRISGS